MISEHNPQIRCVLIGKKNVRELEILPLSISDQFKLSDIISQLIAYAVAASQKKSEAAFYVYVVRLIQGNLERILSLITREKQPRGIVRFLSSIKRFLTGGSSILEDVTSEQAWELAVAIYEMNYQEILKKVQSLLKRTEDIPEPLRRLWQSFSEVIPNIDMKTFSNDLGQKEE